MRWPGAVYATDLISFFRLFRQGHVWNHRHAHRIYYLSKLNFRPKGKQRLLVCNPAPLATLEALNQSWSVDFMHNALTCGRRFRTFYIVDDFNREALAIDIDLNIRVQRMVLNRIVANRGYPLKMRIDNDSGLVSRALAQWAEEHCLMLEFIKRPHGSLKNRKSQIVCGNKAGIHTMTSRLCLSLCNLEEMTTERGYRG